MDRLILRRLIEACEATIPDFELRYKEEHWHQKALGTLLRPFVPNYATQYTTTLYPRVYFAKRSDVERHPRSAWKTLAHELVHLWDQRQRPLSFPLGYLSPQLWALGVLGLIAVPWTPLAWLSLLSLVALAPWPSPWRVRAELRGYAMELAIKAWTTGRSPSTAGIRSLFTGWAYYRMCARQERVDAMLGEITARLAAGELPFEEGVEPYILVRDVLVECARIEVVDELL